MDYIDISKELGKFERHLENNRRTIFSAKFGDGKTYFLDAYRQQHKLDTLFIVLHPINYSVATNEDIFEYIKRDILVELSKKPEFKEVDWKEVAKTVFDYDALLETSSELADALPEDFRAKPLAKAILVPFKLFKKMDNKFAIDKFFDRFSEMQGGIFEQDHFTAAIKATVAKIQETGRKCVLIIEDLDRIDPGHLFRILNVLGAHIDDDADTNKFGFDNIIAVLDYHTTEHIFKHFYGAEANYSGYMAKFICHNIFEYSITKIARGQLMEFLRNECQLDDAAISQYEWYQDNEFKIRQTIQKHVATLSVRDIVHILDNLEEQYYIKVIGEEHNVRIPNAPILKMLSVFVRMNFHFTVDNVFTFLTQSRTRFGLLGNFVCANNEFQSKLVSFRDGEEYVIHFIGDNDRDMSVQYGGGSYIGRLDGNELRKATENMLSLVFASVYDCKPLTGV